MHIENNPPLKVNIYRSYEFSYINFDGVPVVALLELALHQGNCLDTMFLKKLLNSLTETKFSSQNNVTDFISQKIIEQSNLCSSDFGVNLVDFSKEEIVPKHFTSISSEASGEVIQYVCNHTAQPMWCSVLISNENISETDFVFSDFKTSLLSLAASPEIIADLVWEKFKPLSIHNLTVQVNGMRRGGITTQCLRTDSEKLEWVQ